MKELKVLITWIIWITCLNHVYHLSKIHESFGNKLNIFMHIDRNTQHITTRVFPVRIFAVFKFMLRSRRMTESGKCDIGVGCRFYNELRPVLYNRQIGGDTMISTTLHLPTTRFPFSDFNVMLFLIQLFDRWLSMVHWPAKSDQHISPVKNACSSA